MTEEIIIDGELSCNNCLEKTRCKQQQKSKEQKINAILSYITNEDNEKYIAELKNEIPAITRCDVVLEKQFKRLEQERDELKKTVENQKLEYEELQCDLSEVENACGCYQSENAELKQENKELKKQIESDKGLITVGGKQQYEMTKAYDKCKTALEEIRTYLDTLSSIDSDFTNTETYLRIQDKINEVLNLS